MILSFLRVIFAILWTGLISALEVLTIPLNGKDGRLFHALARIHARGVLALCGIRLDVEGAARVPLTRNYVYVANHASLFDIPAVVAGIPDQIRIVYKKELEKVPVFGWGLKYGKTYICIDRGGGHESMRGIDEAVETIRGGASVILFAEGTRTSDGTLQPFKRGPFHLAVRAGVPVVPVTIDGSYEVLPRGSWRIRPGTIKVILSEPLESPPPNGKNSELALRDAVHRVISNNAGKGRG